jgi:predicted SAM-dependent methyltransferase
MSAHSLTARIQRFGTLFRDAFREARVQLWERDHVEASARADKIIIDDYLREHTVRKLQIGAGDNSIAGWLSTDNAPVSEGIVRLDATREFPFGDAVFDYAYSEHMIEHLTLSDARKMVAEMYRVLKPGGRVRIATPDLQVFAALCLDGSTETQRAYVDWAVREYNPDSGFVSPSVVVNQMFRGWGPQFLYDQETLSKVLSQAGFSGITRCEVGKSEDPELAKLEGHWRKIGESNNRFETMVLEARKVPNSQ